MSGHDHDITRLMQKYMKYSEMMSPMASKEGIFCLYIFLKTKQNVFEFDIDRVSIYNI